MRMQPKTVFVPVGMEAASAKAKEVVSSYFEGFSRHPEKGMIEIAGERYVLVRAASLAVEFFDLIESLFDTAQKSQADAFARNMLFDLAHAIGRADARRFHDRMNLRDPVSRLSAGPVHFAYCGWALVDIHPESNLTPGEEFCIIYDHPYSFEADAWVRQSRHAEYPICIMNAGYSSGWSSESFGMSLVASEILCRARGDECCRFIMASSDRIEARIRDYVHGAPELAARVKAYEIPDLFSRKRADLQLKGAERTFRAVFDHASDAFFINELNGRMLEVNRVACEQLGYSHEELMNMTSAQLDTSTDAALYDARVEELRKKGWAVFEAEHRTKGGEVIPIELSVSLIEYEGVPAVLSIARDITDQRRIDEALRESKRRFEEVAECAEEWIWEVDARGVYTYSNAVVERILGYRPEELVGKRAFYEFFDADARDSLRGGAFEAFERREPIHRYLNRNVHRDGSIVYLETNGVPILGRSDTLLGYRGVDTDVTEGVRLRHVLAESEERVGQLSKELDEQRRVIEELKKQVEG